MLVAVRDVDRLQDLDVADRGLLATEARAVQQLDERQGRTVQDRQFGPVDLDDHVGDAQGAEGGHQVFYGRQLNPGRVLDHGVQPRIDHGLAGHDDAIVTIRDIRADEDDARSGGRRTNGQANPLSGVHTHARTDGGGDQRPFAMIGAWRQGLIHWAPGARKHA